MPDLEANAADAGSSERVFRASQAATLRAVAITGLVFVPLAWILRNPLIWLQAIVMPILVGHYIRRGAIRIDSRTLSITPFYWSLDRSPRVFEWDRITEAIPRRRLQGLGVIEVRAGQYFGYLSLDLIDDRVGFVDAIHRYTKDGSPLRGAVDMTMGKRAG